MGLNGPQCILIFNESPFEPNPFENTHIQCIMTYRKSGPLFYSELIPVLRSLKNINAN